MTHRRTRIKHHFVIVACWWSIYWRSLAWVESLALLTSLRCDSTQADRVVRPIRIRCKLWGGEGYCESKAHDYDYSWPGLEPKSLDPESRTAGKLEPAPSQSDVKRDSVTRILPCFQGMHVFTSRSHWLMIFCLVLIGCNVHFAFGLKNARNY